MQIKGGDISLNSNVFLVVIAEISDNFSIF